MKIILVATDAKGKNVVFVSDTLRAYSLDEAVRLAKGGELEGIYAVQKKNGTYLRSRRSVPTTEQLEYLSVYPRQFFAFADDLSSALSHKAFSRYLKLYESSLTLKQENAFIIVDVIKGISQKEAKKKLQSHREFILEAARNFSVDPYLLGAIIIDELARLAPFEEIRDKLLLSYINKNVSDGIAQVKIETARGLIKSGYYNPDPDNTKLSPEKVDTVSREDLYKYIELPKQSIFFAAARMRALADRWKKFVDLDTLPHITATLYHLPDEKKKPHANPKPNERGLRIAGEFYSLARIWLQ